MAGNLLRFGHKQRLSRELEFLKQSVFDIDLNLFPYRHNYRTFSECGPRWKNEDTIRVVEMPEQGRSLFILCDGMGRHRCGDVNTK